MATRLWTWVLEAYARPGVEPLCLELQDVHGQSVPLLLWTAWANGAAEPAIARAAALCRQWEAEVTGHLRAARRGLKPAHHLIDDAARERLRTEVKSAELQAERVLLDSLAAMAPDAERSGGASLIDRLRTAIEALGAGPVPEALLADLAGRLSAKPVESGREIV